MLIEELDHITPADAFCSLRDLPMPFLMSGTKTGRRRHSFVAADPLLTVRTTRAGTSVFRDGKEAFSAWDPFEALRAVAREYPCPEQGPFPFNSGIAGYFGYDLGFLIEPALSERRSRPAEADEFPLCNLALYDPLFVYDHCANKAWIVSAGGRTKRAADMKQRLASRKVPRPSFAPACGAMTSNMTKEEYLSLVQAAKDYISDGDIYQINLSQRLNIKWDGDPLALYLKLLESHPAEYSSFFDYGGFQVVSNSPERLMSVNDGIIETMPIKGTRKRGRSAAEDKNLIAELKNSAKERAEHVMIVDLERNDLGRICLPGTVEVTGFGEIETLKHLHHMVSTVRGRLSPDVDGPAALRSIFPGGSITGAPKIRAMEIIDELETVKRGIYTGGIGWMDLNGRMDIAMAIRTAVCTGDTFSLHVGGGIVADSDPESEYSETLLKATDFLSSIGIKTGCRT